MVDVVVAVGVRGGLLVADALSVDVGVRIAVGVRVAELVNVTVALGD
ncbi:MAG TPA: hypothetical protein VMW17_11440 [Candidatus Binatia bacterium]|nr:hypothetical protein [Candidatus Binatia bacterium]